MKAIVKKRTYLFYVSIGLTFLLLYSRPAAAGDDYGFLWRIKNDRGTAYLFGSLHLAKPDFYPLDRAIMAAYASSDLLVVEADTKAIDQNKLAGWLKDKGEYPAGDGLSKHISDRTKAKAKELEINLAEVETVRPWLLAVTLQVRALVELGYDEKFGLDKYFLTQAHEIKRQIIELEGIEAQLKLFTDLPDTEQDLFLYQALLELEEVESIFSQTTAAWRRGDLKNLEEIFFRGFKRHPELAPLADKLIFKRNLTMLEQIAGLIKDGRTPFIVIGAGHLVGPQNVVSGLQEKGFEVERIKMQGPAPDSPQADPAKK